jgi:hypothetical protein
MNILHIALTFAAALSLGANAACLDPKDPSKTFRPTLEQETRSADAIVVGTVVKVVPLSEDRSDPQGYTAFLYTVRVDEQLRGSLPAEIQVRAENDSGGYRMAILESHLLFLTTRGPFKIANACGNSVRLQGDKSAVNRVKALLAGASHAV